MVALGGAWVAEAAECGAWSMKRSAMEALVLQAQTNRAASQAAFLNMTARRKASAAGKSRRRSQGIEFVHRVKPCCEVLTLVFACFEEGGD
jgi:hypothetical protein